MYVYRVVVVMVRRIIAQAAGSLLFDVLVYVFFWDFDYTYMVYSM